MGMQLIETIDVGSGGVGSIEFTGIPQDGVDLLVKFSNRSSNSSNYLSFNGDDGTTNYNYASRYLEGQGGSGSGPLARVLSNEHEQTIPDPQRTSTTSQLFGNGEIYVTGYALTGQKSYSLDYVTEDSAATAFAFFFAAKYAGTAAITSLKIRLNQQEFSTFSLYKVTTD